MDQPPRLRIAVDLLGGDRAPESVVDGALLALVEQPDVAVTLVGPPDIAQRLLEQRNAAGRCEIVAASEVVTMGEDPARGVRRKRDATVRVAARMVRDGAADAVVSVGSSGAALAAALFTLGRLPRVSRPALAVVLPVPGGEVVLLDVGATPEATPALLVQFAFAGAALARIRRGVAEPRVGLLSNGAEPGKGDEVRKAAHPALAAALAGAGACFVGNVEGGDVPLGGRADVIVTDGFTGNVLLKGLEGVFAMLDGVVGDALARAVATTPALREAHPVVRAATRPLDPEQLGGALLLGVDGVSVVGHGASSARAVAACIALAADAVRSELVPHLRADLACLPGPAAPPGAPIATGARSGAGPVVLPA